MDPARNVSPNRSQANGNENKEVEEYERPRLEYPLHYFIVSKRLLGSINCKNQTVLLYKTFHERRYARQPGSIWP